MDERAIRGRMSMEDYEPPVLVEPVGGPIPEHVPTADPASEPKHSEAK